MWNSVSGRMRSLLVLSSHVALFAGCGGSDEPTTCDDGRTCPQGTVCDTVHASCAFATQLDACVGKAERAPCSYAGLMEATAGSCDRGVCIEARCGNSLLDGAEDCDDGNTLHGDGCSADCMSNEICGNGVLDAITGEACDDGNSNDGDGCQATCVLPACGDGVVDTANGEACDDGTANSNAPDAACRTNCEPKRCGDAVLDTGEVCDDGNNANGDGCSADCLST